MDIELNGLTLTGGAAPNGGAIRALENLTVRDAVLNGNSAGPGGPFAGLGGAIWSQGGASVTITDSDLSNNTAAVLGGALFARNAGTMIRNSTLANNAATDGGAIWALANVTVENSTLSGNSADGFGGAAKLGASNLTIRGER